MPRAPSEKKGEAEKLFNKGMKLTEIAEKLGVPEGTVRSWKNRGKWGVGVSKKNERNVANKSATNATLQKRKRGAPKGNQNAKGGRGNPHPNTLKHGVYCAVLLDALDDEERELIGLVSIDEEHLLIEEIQIATLRERNILKAMKKYREQKGDVAVSDVTRTETKRSFKDDAERELYEQIIKEKVSSGERLPGESYNIQTRTTNKDIMIARWEQELSTVQNRKIKAIEPLSKIRMERAKAEKDVFGEMGQDMDSQTVFYLPEKESED